MGPTPEARYVDAVLDAGRQAYGDLGIDRSAAQAALARIADMVLAAERSVDPETEIGLGAIVDRLVLEDVYLSEALLQGRSIAWATFEQLLERAFRSVRAHFSGRTPRALLDEIRESILGTFFIDGKIEGYRATAPIGAWGRQVVFNLFRQRINLRHSGREPASLSQLSDEEGGSNEALLPPSREPGPPEIVQQNELGEALRRAVPEAMASLDRDEHRMLDVLPTKRMTQIDLAAELGVSPFKLNRWYKEVRERFLRSVTRHVREIIGLEEQESERLVDHLVALWARDPKARSGSELSQPEPPG
ncbi:MAG: hypothetical protein HRU14_01360 [Planctomycetes bacterium]|nr:hypothetical protein [Planctomycetota bacterium]